MTTQHQGADAERRALTPAPTLTPTSARRVLGLACTAAGLSSESAETARFGENALFRLPEAGIMVRIGRSMPAAVKESDVARWLAYHDFPAVRLAADHPHPLSIDGFPVTFWELMSAGDCAPTSADLGVILRRLHALPAPTDFTLPEFALLPKVRRRLDALATGEFPMDVLEFFRVRCGQIEEQYSALTLALPAGPIHGDAHGGNLFRQTDGAVRLIDFEDFTVGPREWDIAVEATRYKTFGWVSADNYRAFVDAYGFDLLTWPGLPVLTSAREVNMTTWLMQQLGNSEEVDAEIRRRVDDLYSGSDSRSWSAV